MGELHLRIVLLIGPHSRCTPAARSHNLNLPPEYQDYLGAFREGLQKLGWIEGRNLRIDTRWGALDDTDVRQRSAEELLALQPDIILTQNTPAMAGATQGDCTPRQSGRFFVQSGNGALLPTTLSDAIHRGRGIPWGGADNRSRSQRARTRIRHRRSDARYRFDFDARWLS
jgi:hypothetical protein